MSVGAIALAKLGAHVDTDTVDPGLHDTIAYYLEHGGDPERLTVSSDCGATSPRNLFDEIRRCILDHGMTLERILPFATSNTAAVLKLPEKGCLRTGLDGDVVILERESLEIVEVIARGKRMVIGGSLAVDERFLKSSNRRIDLTGTKKR